ncbi:unnamed protein product [marine sediment metagenome]|uniref:Uncharacterized protein n=1 Tax=marine sediment metagenome TaxID=412755 RepID=X1QUF8_9ZZZZ
MSGGFNPLGDLAAILVSFAKKLPPLPPPPFPLPKPPEVESPSSPSGGYVDVRDEIVERQMEKHRAEQKAKGLIVLNYE